MPATLTRRTFDLAGLEVPALDFTGAGDGPRLTVLAGAVAAGGLLLGLGIR